MPLRPLRRLRAKTPLRAEKCTRQARRRRALICLNELAGEMELGTEPLRVKERRASVVTRRIRLLEPRCQEGELPQRLRTATELWVSNGGKLMQGVLPPPAPADHAPLDESGEAAAPLPQHKVLDSAFRLKSHGFMVTYNCEDFSQETWPAFREHMRSLARAHKARAWAANWEQSLQASDPAGGVRFHGHGYLLWTDGVGFNRRNTDVLVFQGVRPRVDVCVAKSPVAFHKSAIRGLWYASIFKKGTYQATTNYPPWRHYTPKAAWLEDLWGAHKLTHTQYGALSVQFGRGHSSRRRDALDALRDERDAKVRRHVESELKLLHSHGKIKAAKLFEQANAFVQLFSGAPRFRRPILAIVGGTNLGKSMLAADTLLKVAHTLGMRPDAGTDVGVEAPYLEVTIEDSMQVDLSELDVTAHAGVLLDGVGDAQFLKRNREILQGRPKICKGGKSGTMIYAYPFSLCRRAVVATFDLSAANLSLLRTDHWLADPRNVLQLHLDVPAWEAGDGAPAVVAAVVSPRAAMSSWTVDKLMEFLIGEDMRGPGEALRAAGVNGADFLAWGTPAELQTDLKLTPFTARKLIAVRDAFLA